MGSSQTLKGGDFFAESRPFRLPSRSRFDVGDDATPLSFGLVAFGVRTRRGGERRVRGEPRGARGVEFPSRGGGSEVFLGEGVLAFITVSWLWLADWGGDRLSTCAVRSSSCFFISTSCCSRARFCFCSSSLDSSCGSVVAVVSVVVLFFFLLLFFFSRLALPFCIRFGVGCARARSAPLPLLPLEAVSGLGLAGDHRLPVDDTGVFGDALACRHLHAPGLPSALYGLRCAAETVVVECGNKVRGVGGLWYSPHEERLLVGEPSVAVDRRAGTAFLVGVGDDQPKRFG